MVVKVNNQEGASFREAVEQQINEGETLTLRVTGRSMRPYLSGAGDEFVIVSKHQQEELKRGRIILFSRNGRHVFHRIIGKKNGIWIAQGDGNYAATEEVRPEEVLGIVRFIVRSNDKRESPYRFAGQVYWRIWYLVRRVRRYIGKRC